MEARSFKSFFSLFWRSLSYYGNLLLLLQLGAAGVAAWLLAGMMTLLYSFEWYQWLAVLISTFVVVFAFLRYAQEFARVQYTYAFGERQRVAKPEFVYVTWNTASDGGRVLYISREDGDMYSSGRCKVSNPHGDTYIATFRSGTVSTDVPIGFVRDGTQVLGKVRSLRYPADFKDAPDPALTAGRYWVLWTRSVFDKKQRLLFEELVTIDTWTEPPATE